MKYRKKPVVIEAFQLNERGLVGEDWFWDAVTRNDIITHDFGKYHPNPAWCEIKTLEGTMIAKAGETFQQQLFRLIDEKGWRLYYPWSEWRNISLQTRYF